MTPMHVAYADPPYLGCCGLYQHRHDDGCWNDVQTHANLIARLTTEFRRFHQRAVRISSRGRP